MESVKRSIKVFLASPGDLADERECFRQTLRELNAGFGDGADVEFIPKGWEDCPSNFGRRPQSVINQLIDDCDVFILALHKRWGQDAEDAHPSDSYTEEEFQYAQALYESNKIPRIFVFFKNIEPELELVPDSQLQKVLAFKSQFAQENILLHRSFSNEATFKEEVEWHLKKYVKGELPDVNDENDKVIFPIKVLDELKKAKELTAEAKKKSIDARDDQERMRLAKEMLELEMAQDAATLSKEGKIEFARKKFAKLSLHSNQKEIIFLSYEFYYRIGDFNAAESLMKRASDLADLSQDLHFKAGTAVNLGNVYRCLGKYTLAKNIAQQALEFFNELGDDESKAIALQSLGAICFQMDDIYSAEKYYEQTLMSFLELNHDEGIAVSHSNLGDINFRSGKFSDAEINYKKALDLYQKLENVEGIADQLGKIANTYLERRKYKDAQFYLQQALTEDIKLGRKLQIAQNRNNLGLIYKGEADYRGAELEFTKALEIASEEGYNRVIVDIYGNLGNLYALQAMDKSVFLLKVNLSERAYKKALEISEALGNKLAIASNKHNLGALYLNLSNINLAEPLLFDALRISEEIGDKIGIAGTYNEIGRLYSFKGQIDQAIVMIEKALSLFMELKSPDAEISASLLEELKSSGI